MVKLSDLQDVNLLAQELRLADLSAGTVAGTDPARTCQVMLNGSVLHLGGRDEDAVARKRRVLAVLLEELRAHADHVRARLRALGIEDGEPAQVVELGRDRTKGRRR